MRRERQREGEVGEGDERCSLRIYDFTLVQSSGTGASSLIHGRRIYQSFTDLSSYLIRERRLPNHFAEA